MGPLGYVPIAAAGAGAAAFAYAAGYEVRAFRLRQADVPVLTPGAKPIRLLHISDLHMTPNQRKKREWVRSLADLRPDIVINTGDSLAHPLAVSSALDALEPLLRRPGAHVFGSNDYFAPIFVNPARYLWSHRLEIGEGRQQLPWKDLQLAFDEAGWVNLSNARGTVRLADGRVIELAGVDDPHIDQDRYAEVAGPAGGGDYAVSIGVVHAPYRRVLDRMAADGFPLIVAGHTHGGQVCLPIFGTIVSNCDLDRRRARGLSRYGSAWLHVSAGLGTSPYAPFRFACPPEATLLTLTPRADAS